jgi:hypothetical protein
MGTRSTKCRSRTQTSSVKSALRRGQKTKPDSDQYGAAPVRIRMRRLRLRSALRASACELHAQSYVSVLERSSCDRPLCLTRGGIGPRSDGEKNKNSSMCTKFELAMEWDMLSRAEEYRQRARDCEQVAQETIDAVMKGLFQELCNQWLHLASEAELAQSKEKMQ